MDKYTLKTIFEKSFSGLIWRIEADTTLRILALETRRPNDGIPYFSAIHYPDGQPLAWECRYGGRSWTLAGTRRGYLILRAYGEREPEGPGIICLSSVTGGVIWEKFNYTFLELGEHSVQARPHQIANGQGVHFSLDEGERMDRVPLQKKIPTKNIVIPKQILDPMPHINWHYPVVGTIHHHAFGEREAWAFHVDEGDTLSVKLLITRHGDLLEERTIMEGMERMTPEIFFVIDRQLFFITGNKHKIVSYFI